MAALPSLGGKDYTSKWYTVGKAPVGKAPTVRIDSDSLQWPDYRQARYSILADDVTITPPADMEFTFTDAIATGLSIMYLCDMVLPSNTTGSWRFLAEDVCGLPTNIKGKTPAQAALINILT